MFTEEKLIQALKNFSLQEMFTSAGQDPNVSLPSEKELEDGTYHSAGEDMTQPEMILNAEPYQPKHTNFQSAPAAKSELVVSSSTIPDPEKITKMDEIDLSRQINAQLQDKLD